MRLKYKFLSAFIILLLISLACGGGGEVPPPADSTPATPPSTDTVTVTKVIDGDTIELSDGRRVRYIGINTPERDQPFYQEASETNRQLVERREIRLEFDQDTFDQYGRTLAYIWVEGQMVNLTMLKLGFANAFTVPPNVRYEAEFRAAEREAREAERGLWAGSSIQLRIIQIEADAPGDDRQNPNGEWIEIANQGDEPVQMQGYTLKDEANHIYTFADFVLAPGRAFRLFSGQGQNGANALYWGLRNESVWNNGSDAAFLRDASGALVDTFAY